MLTSRDFIIGRSHDRKSPNEPAQIDKHDIDYLIQQPEFVAIDSDFRGRPYESTPEMNRLIEKASNNCDFSPLTSAKHNCELFYEDEVLRRKHTVHSDYEFAPPAVKSVGSPCLKYSSLDRKCDEDICPRKLNFMMRADAKNNLDGEPVVGGFSSESEGVDDRIKVRPFSTERLKATRHRLKNIVLSILENGEVCLEWLRSSKSKNKETVVEVVRISKNGSKVRPNPRFDIQQSI